jgi:spore photoproduct lyase
VGLQGSKFARKRAMAASLEIQRIYLDPNAREDRISKDVLKAFPGLPVEIVGDKRVLIKGSLPGADALGEGKRSLFITRFYGKRLKPCPGTSNHICCGYQVINVLTNCPMDCSYCVLQAYLNNPLLTLYSNWDDLLQEIDVFLSERPHSLLRLGTGELSDSLALEPIFPVSQLLVPYFAQKDNAVLELKTKSVEIGRLLHLDHRNRTVVSWSLNPQEIIDQEEKRTASLGERIGAAYRCQEAGYPIGFHFDPIFNYDGWEEGYREAVSRLFERVDPKRVIWVSLGGFRYPRELKKISKERFPRTGIFLGELFAARDGKFRYLQEIRIEMYRKIRGWLREVDPDLFVYLCMESKEVWEEVFGWAPSNSSHLNQLFEQRVRTFIMRD